MTTLPPVPVMIRFAAVLLAFSFATVTLPPNTVVQYKYVKWNGTTAAWESNQSTTSGNRELTTPASCSAVIDRNDGNFKP